MPCMAILPLEEPMLQVEFMYLVRDNKKAKEYDQSTINNSTDVHLCAAINSAALLLL